jgi:hypothetical protein
MSELKIDFVVLKVMQQKGCPNVHTLDGFRCFCKEECNPVGVLDDCNPRFRDLCPLKNKVHHALLRFIKNWNFGNFYFFIDGIALVFLALIEFVDLFKELEHAGSVVKR